MPPQVKLSSTNRRARLADKIDRLGFATMAPCPECVESNSICVIHKSSSRCSVCQRKNIKCGGVFSDAEFDSLERKKEEISKKKMDARARLTVLAWEILALQKQHDELDRMHSKIIDRQEKMVEQEARALDELDLFVEFGDPQLAMMSPVSFPIGDILAESGVMEGQPSGTG